MVSVKYVLKNGAYAPKKNNPSDAGYDLFSPINIDIPEKGSAEIDLKIAFEIPSGYWGGIHSRSGMAFRNDIIAHLGVIDPGYRGTVKVKLFNFSDETYKVRKGDKVCQLVLHPVYASVMMRADVLSESDRGENGFGSSGR